MSSVLTKIVQRVFLARTFPLKNFSCHFAYSGVYEPPLSVQYRAAMKQDAPLDDLPLRVNFIGKPYKPVELNESFMYIASPG